jgi:hypothetical protein
MSQVNATTLTAPTPPFSAGSYFSPTFRGIRSATFQLVLSVMKGEHVAQISMRIDVPSPTTLDNFVGDGIVLS